MKNIIYFLSGLMISMLLVVPYAQSASVCDTDLSPAGITAGAVVTSGDSASLNSYYSTLGISDWTLNLGGGGTIVSQWTQSGCSFTIYQSVSNLYTNMNCSGWSYGKSFAFANTPNLACVPQEPLHCSNGIKDNDEIGFDCGGSCSAECSAVCRSGFQFQEFILDDGSPSGIFGCARFAASDPVTQTCPPNMKRDSTGATTTDSAGNIVPRCIQIDLDFYFGNADNYDDVLALDPDYESGVQSPEWEPPITSITDQWNEANTVDHGDGTETRTVTNNKTSSDGSSSTETISVTVPSGSAPGTGFKIDSAGNVVGVADGYTGSHATTGTSATSDNLENQDTELEGFVPSTDLEGPGSVFDGLGEITDLPEEHSLTASIAGMIASSPTGSMFSNLRIETSNPVCSISFGSPFGHALNLDMCRWEPNLQPFGALFLALAHLMAVIVVWRGWK